MQLSKAVIEAAIIGFERQKDQIDETIAELRAQLGDTPGKGPKTNVAEATTQVRARRKMSAAGRKRIAEAQRKRWAAAHKEAAPATKKSAPKRKLSAAAKARLAENLKKARAAKAARAKS